MIGGGVEVEKVLLWVGPLAGDVSEAYRVLEGRKVDIRTGEILLELKATDGGGGKVAKERVLLGNQDDMFGPCQYL